jgi:hypothetical protein
MIHLDLKYEERQALVEVLENEISELSSEIFHTERLEYKSMLKSRKKLLMEMLEHLRTAPVAG